MGKEVKMIIKKDLLEKLNDIDETADVTEILKGIDGIAEVKEIPFDVNKLTVEDYKNILETNKAIQGYNQSQLDSAVSKGVESFKTKKMPGIIESEIKKATAPKHETPEQKAQREQMEAMETRLKEMEEKNAATEKKNAENEAKLAHEGRIKESRTYLAEMKYPKQVENFLEFVVGEDMDISKQNIDKLANAFSEYGQEVLKTDMTNNPFNPSGGGNGDSVDPVQAQVNQILGLS